MRRPSAFRRPAVRLLRGIIILSTVAAMCFRIPLNDASTALLLLIALVIQTLDCSFREAAVLAVFATGLLDYFFTDPVFSFAVSGPLEAITLTCMLAVSLVITRIQTMRRAEEEESNRQRAKIEGLYKLSQALLALPARAVAGPGLLGPVLSAFNASAVCLFDASTCESYSAGESDGGLAAKTRDGYVSGRSTEYPDLRISVQCLRVGDKVLGALGIEGLEEGTAPALAALAAAALERAVAFRTATAAAAHAEAEVLRSAILDALAHEFKTPLATILTAAGGLRVTEPAAPEQAELAEIIETETSRLSDLTTRLLHLARVDRDELKPRLVSGHASEIAGRCLRRYSKLWPDRRVLYRESAESREVLVDPDLIGLAISQLLENACRYSCTEASVSLELGVHEDMAAITVSNDGQPIPQWEQERIFERFYRGTDARRNGPGSGLGLYVARKIARAHGGGLILADNRERNISFRLTLPFSHGDAEYAERQI